MLGNMGHRNAINKIDNPCGYPFRGAFRWVLGAAGAPGVQRVYALWEFSPRSPGGHSN